MIRLALSLNVRDHATLQFSKKKLIAINDIHFRFVVDNSKLCNPKLGKFGISISVMELTKLSNFTLEAHRCIQNTKVIPDKRNIYL